MWLLLLIIYNVIRFSFDNCFNYPSRRCLQACATWTAACTASEAPTASPATSTASSWIRTTPNGRGSPRLIQVILDLNDFIQFNFVVRTSRVLSELPPPNSLLSCTQRKTRFSQTLQWSSSLYSYRHNNNFHILSFSVDSLGLSDLYF